jgi:hypothetical protein
VIRREFEKPASISRGLLFSLEIPGDMEDSGNSSVSLHEGVKNNHSQEAAKAAGSER